MLLWGNGLVAEILAWIALTFYTACFIPQMLENYRYKSVSGLSDMYLVAYFVAYASLAYYVFCLDLFFPYKVMVPIECIILAFIIGQRFYYDGFFIDWKNRTLFWISVMMFVGLFPFAWIYPVLVGNICGWISAIFFIITPIPQIWKVYKAKSVVGFSFAFITVNALAGVCELTVAFMKQLPVQTWVMILKGAVFYVIFCYQFYFYRK